jgi:hypothetical protein
VKKSYTINRVEHEVYRTKNMKNIIYWKSCLKSKKHWKRKQIKQSPVGTWALTSSKYTIFWVDKHEKLRKLSTSSFQREVITKLRTQPFKSSKVLFSLRKFFCLLHEKLQKTSENRFALKCIRWNDTKFKKK